MHKVVLQLVLGREEIGRGPVASGTHEKGAVLSAVRSSTTK